MHKSCDDDWTADAHQHLACSKPEPEAAQGKSKNRRHLEFQNTAAEAEAPPRRSSRAHSDRAFLLPAREMLARECARLSRVIRRAAAGCLAPSAGADEDDLPFPYTQLDKVTRAVSREAFGPLYLVT
ncbi:hypothetical protein BS78_01G458000 [Paspalum vaginatum]|nr:hypothetical protein BS78_01G458000 [Paspalum vaginatum]KAJ1298498.1 hypothetical protein BS78_01G458000 [Paspalum vaginatum]